jgi:hypothetical protein
MIARAKTATGRDEPVLLDPEEDEELARRMDQLPELNRLGLLRPVEELLAEVRAEIRLPRTG